MEESVRGIFSGEGIGPFIVSEHFSDYVLLQNIVTLRGISDETAKYGREFCWASTQE
jgi:hypothetical protein